MNCGSLDRKWLVIEDYDSFDGGSCGRLCVGDERDEGDENREYAGSGGDDGKECIYVGNGDDDAPSDRLSMLTTMKFQTL